MATLAPAVLSDADLMARYAQPDPVSAMLPLVRRLEGSADDAISPAGAVGRYQIMPATARLYGFNPTYLSDPTYNEEVARTVLGDLHSRYAGDEPSILAAYNAGPGAADRFRRSGYNPSVLPAETQRYLETARAAATPNQPRLTPVSDTSSPSPAGTISDADLSAKYGLSDTALEQRYGLHGADAPAKPVSAPPATTDTGILNSLQEGLQSGLRGLGRTGQAIGDLVPGARAAYNFAEPHLDATGPLGVILQTELDAAERAGKTPQPQTVAAQPIDFHGHFDPHAVLEKTLHGLAESVPTVAGAIAGGPLGAGGMAGAQAFGSYYDAELQRDPNDKLGAATRAAESTAVDAVATALGWKLFEFAPFKSAVGTVTNNLTGDVARVYQQTIRDMIKNITLQGVALQPAVAMASTVAHNLLSGQDPVKGLPEAYLQGAIPNTILMAAAHIVSPPGMALGAWRTPRQGEATPYTQPPVPELPPPVGPRGAPGGGTAQAAADLGAKVDVNGRPVEPRAAPLAPNAVIGLRNPTGGVERAVVDQVSPDGKTVLMQYEDGTSREHLVSEVLRDRVPAPPPSQQEPAPVHTGPQLTPDEAAAPPLGEPYQPPAVSPRAARRAPQPELDPEATHALNLAGRLEANALDQNVPMTTANRIAALQQVAFMRQQYGVQDDSTPPNAYRHPLAGQERPLPAEPALPEQGAPSDYQHPLATEPAADLGALARARTERPELFQGEYQRPPAPVVTATAQENDGAATRTAINPTPAQVRAGNYPKGKTSVQGIPVSIETPRGAERSGVSPTGEVWINKNDMAHYGHVTQNGQMGADGDHVDAYIGQHPTSPMAFIVDQVDPKTGTWDEHKLVLAAKSLPDAKAIYDAGFSDGSGPQRRGAITPVPIPELKTWLKSGDTQVPYSPEADPDFAQAAADVDAMRGRIPPEHRSPSLFKTIRDMGGIKVKDGEGKPLAFGREIAKNQAGMGQGTLVRKNGLPPDKVREKLAEQGWFGGDPAEDMRNTDLNDLLELMDRGAGGKRVYHPSSPMLSALEFKQMMRDEADRAGINRDDSRADAAKKLIAFRRQGIEAMAEQYETEVDRAVEELSPGARELVTEYGYEPGADAGEEREVVQEHHEPEGVGEVVHAQEPEPEGPPAGEQGAAQAEGRGEIAPEPAAEPVDLGRGVKTEQTVLPGTERSARQLAAGREAAGHGRATTKVEQREPEGLFAPAEDRSQKTLFQVGRNEPSIEKPFYSALTRGIESIKQGKAPPAQWLGIIDNLRNKGVKQEEIDWSGVRDFLRDAKDSVAKSDLVNYLRENEVQVKEVVRGQRSEPPTNEEYEALFDYVANHPWDDRTSRDGANRGLQDLTGAIHVPENEKIQAIGRLEELGVPDHLLSPYREWLNKGGEGAKYGSYVLPGGEPSSYREMLLTLPAKDTVTTRPSKSPEGWGTTEGGTQDIERAGDNRQDFRSGHFDEPNVLAHIRFDDRTGPNGEHILHMAEVQSDWHQKGRREGYVDPVAAARLQKVRDESNEAARRLTAAENDVTKFNNDPAKSRVDNLNARAALQREVGRRRDLWRESQRTREAVEAEGLRTSGIPDAPFKSTWHELAMKRMLRYASSEGYDKLSWDTGATQADRYDLSHQINRIEYEPTDNGKYEVSVYGKDGKLIDEFNGKEFTPQEVEQNFGKDIAQKMTDGHGKPVNGALRNWKSLEGLDLKVGGEGMRAFYDRILPQYLNKYAKRWGAKVESGEVPSTKPITRRDAELARVILDGEGRYAVVDRHGDALATFDTDAQAYDYRENLHFQGGKPQGTPAHSIAITPSMRESVMQGQPLFQKGVQRVGGNLPRSETVSLADDFIAKLPTNPSPAEDKLIREVETIAKRIVPTARIRPARQLILHDRGKALQGEHKIWGTTYTNGARRLIAWSMESPHAPSTLRHEAVHYLRNMNFLSDKEWETLSNAAETGDWIKAHDLDDRYPDSDHADKIEEAVAEEYARWASGGGAAKTPFERIFVKIRNLLVRVAQYLRKVFGKNATAEEIFRSMESGEVGSRPGAAAMERKEPTFVHRGQENTPAFKKWFGKSVVVDKAGNPLTVYHGTSQDFDVFRTTSAPPYFTTDPDEAGRFAGASEVQWRPAPGAANVIPVYLKIERPMTPSHLGLDFKNDVAAARRAGFDGVVDKMAGKTRYQPFSSEQIKSAVGNTGAFNPRDRSILRQEPRNPDGPPQTPEEGRDYIDNTARDLAEHMREKGPGTYERTLQHLSPPSGPELFLRANWLQQHVMGPRTVAELDTKSATMWNAVKDQDEEGTRRVNDLRDHIAKSFLKLPREAQDHVNSVLELDRLANRTRTNDGRSIVARNDKFDLARGSKPGDTIILTPAESAAFFDMQKMYRHAWTNIMEGAARRMGWTQPWSPAMADNLSRITEAAETADHPRARKAFARLRDVLTTMDEQRQAAYMPLMRFGDYFLSVKPKEGKDMGVQGGFPETKWFELVERPPMGFADANPMKMLAGDVTKTGDVPDYAQARIDDLRKQFPAADHNIEHGWLFSKPENLRSLSIPAVEKLMMLMEGGVLDRLKNEASMGGAANKKVARTHAEERYDELYRDLVDAVQDELYENLKAGFKRKSNTVAGYSGDWNRALGSYMNWTSRHVAQQIHGDTVERAYDDIQTRHHQKSIRDFWHKWKQDDESPASPVQRMGTTANQIGFLWTLAMNPASTISIMMHGPTYGIPVLATGTGMKRAALAFAKAYAQATTPGVSLTANLEHGGLHIAIDKIPGLTADERTYLAKLERDGELHAKGADDVRSMAEKGSALWGEHAPVVRKAMDIASSNIAAADQANRVAISLAAYRMARDGALPFMADAWKGNQVWRQIAHRDGISPETMGKFLLTQGVGEWSAKGRSDWGRSPIGRMGMSLHGFQIRFLSNVIKQAFRQRDAGRIALGWTMAALWAAAGLQGLPFVQDTENLIDFLWKGVTKHDPMMAWRVRALLADTGLGKVGADLVLRGPLSIATGVDFSARLGFGKVITDDVMPWFGSDQAALTFPSIIAGAYRGVSNRLGSHQPEAAAASALPAALRHPVQAHADARNGVKSQTGRTMYVPPSKVTTQDTIAETLGFTPLDVARAREKAEYRYRAKHAHGPVPRDMTP